MKKTLLTTLFFMLPLVGTYAQEQTDSLQQVVERITILSRRHKIETDAFKNKTTCVNKKCNFLPDCPVRVEFDIFNVQPSKRMKFDIGFWGYDWCNWYKVIFLIDGKRYILTFNEKDGVRKVNSNATISEMCRYYVNPDDAADYKKYGVHKKDYDAYCLMLALYKTTSDIKIRYEGKDKIVDRDVKNKWLKPLKETFEYYHLLRGIPIK